MGEPDKGTSASAHSSGNSGSVTAQRIGSLVTHDPTETEAVACRLGQVLQAGDVVILTGPLGAGKTTFTRGLADGMGIVEPVTSPTYAIAFVHEHLNGGPNLVHVDAYRLSGLDDLETVDLDPLLPRSVTVVEWGAEYASVLTDTWIEIELDRQLREQEDLRTITASVVGSYEPERVAQLRAIFSSTL